MIGRLLFSTPCPSPNVEQNVSVYALNCCVINPTLNRGKGEGGGTGKIWREGKLSFVRIRMNCFKAEQPSQLLLSGIVDSTELPPTFAGKEENTNNFPARLGIRRVIWTFSGEGLFPVAVSIFLKSNYFSASLMYFATSPG